MGACASKPLENDTLDHGIIINDRSQAAENKRKQHELEHRNNLNQVAINWRSNTIGIWKRTHDKLAIHTDIPRLGHKIDIIDKLGRLNNISFTSVSLGASQSNLSGSPTYNVSSNQLLSTTASASTNNNIDNVNDKENNNPNVIDNQVDNNSNNNNSNGIHQNDNQVKFTESTTMLPDGGFVTSQVLKKEEVVLQVLLALARLLDGVDKESSIRKEFHNYIRGAGDMSQQLLQLLEHVIGEESRMMQLLKVCHQKIILPSYYFIKSNMVEELPFRDKRGSWRLRIVFEEDGTLTAVHSKRQQSTSGAENDPEFEFEWCLTIMFDSEMNVTHLKVNVVDLIISKSIKDDQKQFIQSAFSSLQLAITASNSNSSCFKPSQNPIPLNKVIE